MLESMKPTKIQKELAEEAAGILKKYMLVYLACEERVGKTIPAIMTAERFKRFKRVLVITKKKALDGWYETLDQLEGVTKTYVVTNYHQAHKIKSRYDLVILDESHNYISSFPKRSSMWNSIAKITVKTPIIYVSATPFAQGYQLLYHQFKLSSWNPWKAYGNPYDWFTEFGIPETIWVQGRQVNQYKKTKPEVFKQVEHLFVTKTRKEAGFAVEPVSKLHYVELNEKTKLVYNTLTKERAIILNGKRLVCDTIAKLRAALHMLEGGVAIFDITKKKKEYSVLGNNEKIRYIKEHFGDSEDTVIMYNYIAEGRKLHSHFFKAKILQATSFAEGVDLMEYKNLIIYSQDFSTARHTQRRARQANKDRTEPIIVHYLLVEKGISEQAYNAVAVNKVNYVDKLYKRELL